MAEARLVTFELRNGEKRTYKDVTRVDDSRRHLVLVYCNHALVAQLNKHDVLRFTVARPVTAEKLADTTEEVAGVTPQS